MTARLQRKLWLLVAGLLLGAGMARGEDAAPVCTPPLIQTAVVKKVADDATLQLEGGETVRLIGVLPMRIIEEARSPGAQRLNDIGRAALARLREKVEGQSVTLRQEGRARDRYDRLLAHGFAADGTWLQGLLLSEGLARAYSYADNRACFMDMLRLEQAAREAHRGLWRFRAFAPLVAADTERILQQQYRFALVEGVVAQVASLRKWTFVNFGADWKSDFTIAIERRWARQMQTEGFDPAALAGRRIRVRGIIERWNGPAIKLTHKEQIEVLDAGPAARPVPE
jgi:endonuclease YncB( thermonuclease family)